MDKHFAISSTAKAAQIVGLSDCRIVGRPLDFFVLHVQIAVKMSVATAALALAMETMVV